jgi:hypothetical protein
VAMGSPDTEEERHGRVLMGDSVSVGREPGVWGVGVQCQSPLVIVVDNSMKCKRY